jgi:hypothetical protein
VTAKGSDLISGGESREEYERKKAESKGKKDNMMKSSKMREDDSAIE